MTWHLGRMAPFDLETTSVDVEQARIVEAYVGRIGGGEDPAELSILVNPGIEVPEEASKVHGYTTDHLREHGHPAAKAVESIAAWVTSAMVRGIPVVGHNVGGYDLTVLDRECIRHGLPGLAERTGGKVSPVIDTLVLSKYLDPYRRRVSPTQGAQALKTCAQVFGVAWDDESAHGARYDALVSARIAWRIGSLAHGDPDSRPNLTGSRSLFDALAVDLADLHWFQVQEKTFQHAEYSKYLRRQGKPTDGLTSAWPYLPSPVAVA